MKSATLYKLGEGPINFEWNQRYFVLDGKFVTTLTLEADRQELNYYETEEDTQRRGSLPLNGGRSSVLLSSIQEIEGRKFSVQIDLVQRRRCCVSFESYRQADEWARAITRVIEGKGLESSNP